jgi:predicted Zn-dependent protease
LRRAQQKRPDDAQITLNLAIALRGAEKWQEAIGYYQKYLTVRPDDAPVIYELANCYEKLGRSDEAVQTYKRYSTALKGTDSAAASRAEGRINELQKKSLIK